MQRALCCNCDLRYSLKTELDEKLDKLTKKLKVVSKKIEDLTLENTQTKRELNTLS